MAGNIPSDDTDLRDRALIVPVISLALLLLLALLPWGLPTEARFVMPMLPFAAIYYWSLGDRGYMPAPVVALAGLTVDIITYGPLGFWSLIYLLGQMAAVLLTGSFSRTAMLRWLGFALVVFLLAGVQWLTASIYFVAWVSWRPFAFAASVVVLFYPVVALLFGRGGQE